MSLLCAANFKIVGPEFLRSEDFNVPQMILTIGIPGSGKSYFSRDLDTAKWEVISADDLRVQHLTQYQNQGKALQLKGVEKIPDPSDAADVFSPELREWVYHEASKKVDEAIAQNKNIFLDITSVTLQRVPFIIKAKKAGYFVKALIFTPSDTKKNLRNVTKRVEAGGLDLAPKSAADPVLVRQEIIEQLKRSFEYFVPNLKQVDFTEDQVNSELQVPDYTPLHGQRGDLNDLLQHENPEIKELANILVNQDSVHQVGFAVTH